MFFDFPFAFPFLCTPWFGKGAMSIPQRGNQLSKGATACLASEKRGSRSPHPPEADSPLVLRALLFTSPLKEAGQARPARGSHIPTAKGVRLWRTLRTWCLPRLKGGPRLSRLPLRGSLIFRTSQNINPIPFLDPGASKAVVSSKIQQNPGPPQAESKLHLCGVPALPARQIGEAGEAGGPVFVSQCRKPCQPTPCSLCSGCHGFRFSEGWWVGLPRLWKEAGKALKRRFA